MANFKESLKNIDFLNLAVVAIGIVGAILSGKQEAQREKQMEATITEKVNDALKKHKETKRSIFRPLLFFSMKGDRIANEQIQFNSNYEKYQRSS